VPDYNEDCLASCSLLVSGRVELILDTITVGQGVEDTCDPCGAEVALVPWTHTQSTEHIQVSGAKVRRPGKGRLRISHRDVESR
jgi:hypothetical protein